MKAFATSLLCVLPLLFMETGCGKKESGKTGGPNGGSGGVSRLNGGGSTFVGPMMKKWATVYHGEIGRAHV